MRPRAAAHGGINRYCQRFVALHEPAVSTDLQRLMPTWILRAVRDARIALRSDGFSTLAEKHCEDYLAQQAPRSPASATTSMIVPMEMTSANALVT